MSGGICFVFSHLFLQRNCTRELTLENVCQAMLRICERLPTFGPPCLVRVLLQSSCTRELTFENICQAGICFGLSACSARCGMLVSVKYSIHNTKYFILGGHLLWPFCLLCSLRNARVGLKYFAYVLCIKHFTGGGLMGLLVSV